MSSAYTVRSTSFCPMSTRRLVKYTPVSESIGKLADEPASIRSTGKVIGRRPEGLCLPVRISVTELPPSWPACQARSTASGMFFQEAVSMTPPTFSTTITFLPAAWKAAVTSLSILRSLSDKEKSALVRSKNSPELRPKVMIARSLLFAEAASSLEERSSSEGRGTG